MVSPGSLRLCSFFFYFSGWLALTDLLQVCWLFLFPQICCWTALVTLFFPFQLLCFSIPKFLLLCYIFCLSLDILILMRYFILSKDLKLWDIVSFNSLCIFKIADLQPFLESLVSEVLGTVSTNFSSSCVGGIRSCFFACLVIFHWKLDVLNIIMRQPWRPDSPPPAGCVAAASYCSHWVLCSGCYC